jgi:hypothetical protein
MYFFSCYTICIIIECGKIECPKYRKNLGSGTHILDISKMCVPLFLCVYVIQPKYKMLDGFFIFVGNFPSYLEIYRLDKNERGCNNDRCKQGIISW